MIYQAADIKQENPLAHYKILPGKGEIGGYSRVYTCERLDDGVKFALKLAKPKNTAQKTDIVNEIGIMQLGSYDSIVKCEQAFFYKDRFWIVLELMDGGALTSMLEEMLGNYSEAFCKYTLYRTVQGLVDLHRQNIIHRDVKSDNILCKGNGEIKIADFGFAVMLTK